MTSSTIPPFQLPDSAKRSRKVDRVAGPEIGTAEIVSARFPSSSSSSRKSEELVSSSQSDSLFGEENPEPTSAASAEANSAMEKSNAELMLRMAELEKRVDELMKTRDVQDAKDKDPETEPSAPLLPLCVRSLRNSLEEPLPETLETVSSTTSQRLNILLEDMDLLDAEEMNTVTKDTGKIVVENEQDAQTACDMDREEKVNKEEIAKNNVSTAEKEPESTKPSLTSKPKKLSGEKPPERSFIRTRSERKMKDTAHGKLEKATVNVITISDSETKVPEPSEPKVDDQDRRREKRPREQRKGEAAELREETNRRKRTKASIGRLRKGSKHEVGRSKSAKPAEDEERQLVPRDHSVSSTAPLALNKQPKDPVIRLKNMKKKWSASRAQQNKGAHDEVTSSPTSTAPSGAAVKDKRTKAGTVDKSSQPHTKGKEPVKSGAPSFTTTDVSTSTKKDELDDPGPEDVFVDKISPLTFVANPSLLPPSIERTCEIKPKRQPMTRRAAETTVLVDVSKDDDSLPDLSLDLRDGKGEGPDNSVISLIPV